MNRIVDMETVEEMIRFLEAEYDAMKETGENIGKSVVFIGQINEKNEEGYMRVSICVSVMEEQDMVRYIEPVGFASIPQEHLKENKETELMYNRVKKDFDVLIEKVEKRKKEFQKLFEEKEYPIFLGVIS